MQRPRRRRRSTATCSISPRWGISCGTTNTRILEVNLAGAALLGLDRSRVVQKRFGQFVAVEDRATFADFCHRVSLADTMQTCEVKILRDGRAVDVLVEGIAAQDRQGQERLCRVAVIDISQQKRADKLAAANQALQSEIAAREQAEKSLRQHQEQLRQRAEELAAIMEVAPVAVWVSHDPQCRQVVGNIYADQIMQVPRHENISASASPGEAAVSYKVFRKDAELKPEEMPAQVATATGKPVMHDEIDLLFPDGRAVHLLSSAVPLFDDAGRVRGMVSAGADITQLKQAEERCGRAR